jgi:intraflagellar transport protein 46
MTRPNASSDNAYDEAIAVETDDDELSTPASSEEGETPQAKTGKSTGAPPGHATSPGKAPRGNGGDESGDESSSGSSSTSGDEDGDGAKSGDKGAGAPAGAYNPDDYKNMKVSSDIKDLFQYITRYKPHTIELDTALKPFCPELIPSVGEVDAFLKMPRPDKAASQLGLTLLDEPGINPSDPSILDLQLRALSKNQELEPMEVRSIENAEKNPKEVENWVRRIDDLNRSKPAPTVQYSRRMPDIETLMQVWPAEFEEQLQQEPLPELAELDLDLPTYIRIIASILDVPVTSQVTESLHVIFTLYSEFKTNQHFSGARETEAMQLDPYNFDNFGQAPPQAASAAFIGGGNSESMAPSRAPSPVGK